MDPNLEQDLHQTLVLLKARIGGLLPLWSLTPLPIGSISWRHRDGVAEEYTIGHALSAMSSNWRSWVVQAETHPRDIG